MGTRHAERSGPGPDLATRRLGEGLLTSRREEAVHPAGPIAVVPSRPETVAWGHVPGDHPWVASVPAGTRVQVDTVSHQGMTTGGHPVRFFERLGIPGDQVLADVIDIYESVPRPDGADSHVLTGPIEVVGARPGDALEIRILDAELRVPYGINRGAPGVGLLPDLLDEPSTRLLHADASAHLVFGAGFRVPACPFPGIVAVLPEPGSGFVRSRIPGTWGGNLDIRELTAGSSLFLPVFRDGAGVFIGDPHSAQGAGEINGTAVEHSSTYTLEFVVHRGAAPRAPIVATPTHAAATGIDRDLNEAVRSAVGGLIDLAVGMGRGRLDEADAYALSSIAARIEVAEAVNVASVVCASLPRSLFAR